MREQAAIVLTAPDGAEYQIGPLGPVGGTMSLTWQNRLQDARAGNAHLNGVTSRSTGWREDLPAVHVNDIPDTAEQTADLMDAWEAKEAYGARAIDLYSLLLCKHGPSAARELWFKAGDIYDALNYDGGADEYRKPDLADAERDRVAALINDELEATAGERDPDDTAGHVAYDTVMHHLSRRTDEKPGGATGEVMKVLIDVIGTMSILDALASGPDGNTVVPMAENVRSSFKGLQEARALLAQMIGHAGASFDHALAQKGLVTVDAANLAADLDDGVPPGEIAEALRARLKTRAGLNR